METARRDLRAALGSHNGAGIEGESLVSIEERLGEANEKLGKSERAQETLETMMRVSPQGGGGAVRVSGSAGTGGRSIAPREYSPRNGVGPRKWFFHMEMFFEYAHISGDDRVSQATILLHDAAEAWWTAPVLETTGADGTDQSDRITTWEQLKDGLGSAFTPVSEKEVARSRLYDLRQTGSLQIYT